MFDYFLILKEDYSIKGFLRTLSSLSQNSQLRTLLRNELFQSYFSMRCILISKSIDWFLWKQPVRGVPWSELFLKPKISKEITQNFSKIFKNDELNFSDVVFLLPVTLLKKKHLLMPSSSNFTRKEVPSAMLS